MPTLTVNSLYQPTILMAVGLMIIIIMMVLPVPPILLDIGLTISFAMAILIFTLTLFVERPLDFSSFPSILLASLLLRLSLNISSTKLIIGEGHTGTGAAGGVIEGFAMFIMGGNLFLGLIVFCVLIIVNFLVITKGAGRMAEIGARFALDAMPGKQMAIDADLAAGAISHEEAKQKREREQEEAAFIGSLDGVSKFVKGDAIAGLLITLLNLVAGLGMGLVVHKISFAEALQNYSILTVGDGLVSQIPAVIISISAAMLLSKGRGEGSIDLALIQQMGTNPQALGTVGVMMMVFAMIPGLPILPFLLIAMLFGYGALVAHRKIIQTEKAKLKDAASEQQKPSETLGDALDIDEIHVELAKDIVPIALAPETGFDSRIDRIRKHVAEEYGFILPAIRLTDNAHLDAGTYRILIQGTEVARSKLQLGKVLALIEPGEFSEISGETVQEPVYGASSRWVDAAYSDDLLMKGAAVVQAPEVLSTHLLETIQSNFARLMTRRALRDILESHTDLSDQERAATTQKLIDEFIPDRVPLDLLQSVLRLILAERISIRNLLTILEAIDEVKGTMTQPEQVVEHVRQRISFHFLAKYKDKEGCLPIIQLAPSWEQKFLDHNENQDPKGSSLATDIALPAEEYGNLAVSVQKQLNDAAAQGIYAVIVTTTRRRRFVKTVLTSKGITNPVMSYDEVAATTKPRVLGAA